MDYMVANPEKFCLTPEATRKGIIETHQIIVRSVWGKLSPDISKLEGDGNYHSIVIHHSGNQGHKDPTAIEDIHMNKHRWPDVGYHYMIHPNGAIYEGRSILYKGSHVFRANSQRIGVLMLGDYDEQWWDFDDGLSKKHLGTLKLFIRTLKRYFGNIKYLGGHLEFAEAQGDERTCPGNLLMKVMDSLRVEFSLDAPSKI